MTDSKTSNLDRFRPLFYPRSVAVVGASSKPQKLGNFALRSAISSGVEAIYPVHAGGAAEILGKKAYQRIEDLPQGVDLFLFALPQGKILSSFEAAIEKGCRAAVIYSGGFKEMGVEGKRQEEMLRTMANEAGVIIIGPNTMGFLRSDSRLNATFMPGMSEYFCPGRGISVVSQSGGSLALIVSQLIDSGLPVGTLVGLGNRANTEFADLLEYFREDHLTSGVLLFIEGIEDIRRFYHAASRCARQLPVVAMSSGHTAAGKKVALSHTGSMASSEKIYQAVFDQAGIVQADNVQEMVDTIKVLTACPTIGGKRAAVVTHTAGPAVIATDVLARGGFQLPEFSQETVQKLQTGGALPDFMPADNPLDLVALGWTEPQRYLQVLGSLLEDDRVDAVLSIYTTALEEEEDISFPVHDFTELAEKKGKETGKAVVAVWGAPITRPGEFAAWQRKGFPVYPTPERAGSALVNLARYSELQRKRASGAKEESAVFVTEVGEIFHKALSEGKEVILEPEATRLLKLAGLPWVETCLAESEEEAVEAAARMGYPVVLKAISEKLLHKSDAGGVKLDLQEEGQVRTAFREIRDNVLSAIAPGELRGIAVQPMLPQGTEVIVGGICDEQAGPVVMIGLGGIWVEVFQDAVFRLAPLGLAEAEEMICSLKGYPVLQGVRGQQGVDLERLQELIVRVGWLMHYFPLQEMDLNPVIFHGSGCGAADARIILSR